MYYRIIVALFCPDPGSHEYALHPPRYRTRLARFGRERSCVLSSFVDWRRSVPTHTVYTKYDVHRRTSTEGNGNGTAGRGMRHPVSTCGPIQLEGLYDLL